MRGNLNADQRREAHLRALRASMSLRPADDLYAEIEDRTNTLARITADLEAGDYTDGGPEQLWGGIEYESLHINELRSELARRTRAIAHSYRELVGGQQDLPARFEAMKGRDCAPIIRALTGQPGRREGQNTKHFCFMHEDGENPNLLIYPPGRGWWCFACNVGGDAVELVAQFKGIDRVAALVLLESDAISRRGAA